MSVISMLAVIIVIGLILWLVNTYVPMAQPIKAILNAVVAVLVVLWLLQIFGIDTHVGPVLK
jgi:hypothetical protein